MSCSVKDDADAFLVATKASVVGANGSVDVSGRLAQFDPGTVHAVFVDSSGRKFDRSSCQVTFPASGGIAKGRVWASLSCPGNGGTAVDTCEISAEIRFENCAQ